MVRWSVINGCTSILLENVSPAAFVCLSSIARGATCCLAGLDRCHVPCTVYFYHGGAGFHKVAVSDASAGPKANNHALFGHRINHYCTTPTIEYFRRCLGHIH
ncbi:hypothetical protein AVEN_231917-1 [Araneus ventricosus]|uniref:Uncharacterized protein n=1 Tax=Araneus ventricosus TaxID=182803 RepID=A0A4Y2TTW4_ARAVE|nr:hypothetical protein AVEN_231917-1 [Araneus ventricosus]